MKLVSLRTARVGFVLPSLIALFVGSQAQAAQPVVLPPASSASPAPAAAPAPAPLAPQTAPTAGAQPGPVVTPQPATPAVQPVVPQPVQPTPGATPVELPPNVAPLPGSEPPVPTGAAEPSPQLPPVQTPAAALPPPPPPTPLPVVGTGPEQLQPTEEQTRLAPNSVYFEVLGSGVIYSINLERILFDSLAVRAGFSYSELPAAVDNTASASHSLKTNPIPGGGYMGGTGGGGVGGASAPNSQGIDAKFTTVPVSLSWVGVRGLEFGAGGTYVHTTDKVQALGSTSPYKGESIMGSALVGCRLHPGEKGGFQLRMGAAILVSKNGVMPWGYLSVGGSI